MPLRGDICQYFNTSMFRFYLRKKYKRSNTFAKRMGVSENSVCAWRTGKSKPTWSHLIKMAEILNIAPRLLIVPSQQHILDKWIDDLLDYLDAPPEVKEQTKTEITIGDKSGSEKQSETKTKRKLKLTAKEALELTEKLGYFDNKHQESEVEAGTENTAESYDPLKDLVEDE